MLKIASFLLALFVGVIGLDRLGEEKIETDYLLGCVFPATEYI